MNDVVNTENSLMGSASQEPKLVDVLPELTRPFKPTEIRWRVERSVKGDTAVIVVPYLDARDIQERLDEVVPGNWEIRFRRESLEGPAYIGGHVVYASLTICGVTREDVGSSLILTPEGGKQVRIDANRADPKTATSDSIKRVAAQFGIGRYLWNMDKTVFINESKDKFKYSQPKHADVDEASHRYLYELGLAGQVRGAGSTELVTYVLTKITDGTISAEKMLEFIKENGQQGINSLVTRMNLERSGE